MVNISLSKTKAGRNNHSLRKRLFRYRYLYLMLAPAIFAMILFHYIPLYGIQIAFKKFNAVGGIWGSQWVGLRYFGRMFREHTFVAHLLLAHAT